MINKPARIKLAELLRHLVSGQITNRQFDDLVPGKSNDRAIWAIRHRAWFLYDDIQTHKLKGKWSIKPEGKKVIARWILFLKSPLEYEWPVHPAETWWGMLISLFSLSLVPRIFWNKKWEMSGNSAIWPFIREKDFRVAKRNPKYLKG